VAVDPNVSLKTLDNQYNEILGLLEKMKHRAGMDEQQAHAALEEAARNYEKAKHELASTQEINRKLRHSLTLRLEKWRKFQRYISSQSRANFIYLLSERGFRGKLLLDHEAKSLDLQVEPDKTEKRAAGRSTKTLSGGEKSFASICLLLAIWEAMGSPLRCLDEFDVFMDNVNRAISTNMLVSFFFLFFCGLAGAGC
jgi:chromosome segregation ATPase